MAKKKKADEPPLVLDEMVVPRTHAALREALRREVESTLDRYKGASNRNLVIEDILDRTAMMAESALEKMGPSCCARDGSKRWTIKHLQAYWGMILGAYLLALIDDDGAMSDSKQIMARMMNRVESKH